MANKQLDWTKPPSVEPASVGQKAGNSCVHFSQIFCVYFPPEFFIFLLFFVFHHLFSFLSSLQHDSRLYLGTNYYGHDTYLRIASLHIITPRDWSFFFLPLRVGQRWSRRFFFVVVFLEVFRNYPSSGIGEQKRCFRMAFIGIPREFCDFHNRRMRVRHPRKAWTEGEILEH